MNCQTFHTGMITQTLSSWFVQQGGLYILTPVRMCTMAGLLLAQTTYAQLSDTFSDGDFTQNPVWSGDNTKFLINSAKLKLQAPVVADNGYLSTPSQAIHNGSWEFYLQMDFNPSSTNYTKVYLVSDQPNLSSPLNGYFVKAGNTAREISLYRQNGSVETKIIDGLDDRINLSVVKVKIKVTRNASGSWQLFSDVGPTGNYIQEGTVVDANLVTSGYLGVHCIYTATRSDKFWFDDFIVTGVPVPDTTPPTIQSIVVPAQTQISVTFSEPVDLSSAQANSNYAVLGFTTISSAFAQTDYRTVIITLPIGLANGVTYNLQISGVRDLSGNQMTTSVKSVMF